VWQNAFKAGISCAKFERLVGFAPALERQWLTLVLFFWVAIGLSAEPRAVVANARSQETVVQILQTVIQDYWNGGYTNGRPKRSGSAIYTNVETAFREASRLMPDRLDLRFGIASSVISQATQTNGQQLEMKVREALQIYQEIQALDTNGFEAPIWYAAYARAIGDTNASDNAIRSLMILDPGRTGEYLQKFNLVDHILRTTPNETPQKEMPKDEHHAIVVLGSGLETNGAMKAKLASRLKQGLRLARRYPRAPIILTGGNQKSGITEAYVMSRWYVRRGIRSKRLILEDKAKDTVENAVFSSAILRRLDATHVTLITSSSHIRRGLADLQEACLQRGLTLEFDPVAAKTKGDADLDPEQERVGIYRDIMRTSGLWAFPGIHR